MQYSGNEIPRAAIDYLVFTAQINLNDIIINSGSKNELDNEISDSIEPIQEPARIELTMPDVLPMHTTLVSEVTLFNARPGVLSLLTWFMDDEIVLKEWIETDTNLGALSHDFRYNHKLAESAVIKAVLQYVTENGNVHYLIDEKTVLLENHDKTYWMELEAERVLEMVSSTYRGDRTYEWALENDYTDFDKEVFVNMMGYESDTAYLVWVNRAHQRVNIFIGYAGNWELDKTFIVATGGPSSMTRRGVTKIPSRLEQGWNFGRFIVKPVVRFFPGTGYAFHSRPIHPVTGEYTDDRIGFPVSAGCIRMACDDIWYMFHNIPDNTTVVIH